MKPVLFGPLGFAMLLLLSTTAQAQVRFRIQEETDALTRETLLVAGDLMVCPVKGQGISCESLKFRWSPSTPESVAVRVELTWQIASVQEVSLRLDGEVRSFHSATTTDIEHSGGLPGKLGWSSANVFVLPISALKALAEDEPSLLRVCGEHDCADFDFRRRAKFRGLPVDELREVIAAIESSLASKPVTE